MSTDPHDGGRELQSLSLWGSGGSASQEYQLTRADMNLARKAINGGYPISPHMAEFLARRACEMFLDPTLDVKVQQNAMDMILRMQDYNLKVFDVLRRRVADIEKIHQPQVHLHNHAHIDAPASIAQRNRLDAMLAAMQRADDAKQRADDAATSVGPGHNGAAGNGQATAAELLPPHPDPPPTAVS